MNERRKRKGVGRIQKFWTTQGNQIGTAHVNREGKIVDFRPATEIYGHDGKIFIYPPKGQREQVGVMEIPAEGVECKIVARDNLRKGMNTVHDIYWARFHGVEININAPTECVWYDKEEMRCVHAESDARRAARGRVERQVKERISFFDIEDFVRTIPPKQASRIRRGKASISEIMEKITTQTVVDGFSGCDPNVKDCDIRDWAWRPIRSRIHAIGPENVKAAIIAADDERRAAKKAEWMAK